MWLGSALPVKKQFCEGQTVFKYSLHRTKLSTRCWQFMHFMIYKKICLKQKIIETISPNKYNAKICADSIKEKQEPKKSFISIHLDTQDTF